MADVAALTGDASYLKAVDAIWESVVGKKLYLTGGIGASGRGEAFGGEYELPNMTAYNETCAAIGNDYWNHRLFLLHGDAKYIDVMERTLYNGLISGVSLDGKSFFYPNPLESNGQHERSPWFGVACCPGNITRFLASVPGYVYALQGDTIFVNLFAKGTAEVTLQDGRKVTLSQETRYPWDGAVRLTVAPERPGSFALKVRIPGWARNEVVPSDLYRFADANAERAEMRVNGTPVAVTPTNGYAEVRRAWTRGDVVELDLPMPVRRVLANDKVEADRGRAALQRGPIVYALEGAGQHERQGTEHRVAGRCTADERVPPRSAQRCAGDQGTRVRPRLRCPGQGRQDRTGSAGDSLCDVGESGTRPDDRVGGDIRQGRATDALADGGHDQHRHHVRNEWGDHRLAVTPKRDGDERRRGSAGLG